MDPVINGSTIINITRRAISWIIKLHSAPQQFERLRTRIETFRLMLEEVAYQTLEHQDVSNALRFAIDQAKASLLEIEKLIDFELTTQALEGKKIRRAAWLRRALEVQNLVEALERHCLIATLLLAAIECRTREGV